MINLFSTLAVQAAVSAEILPAFEAQHGAVVEATYDPTTVLMRRIDDGARPDVVIATVESLGSSPHVVAGSVTPIASTGVGVAVAPGAARPPIGTVDELVAALLAARSVAYSRSGASGIYFAGLLEKLGIAEEVNARATVIEKGFTALAVVDGRADLAIQQVSELRFVRDADILGPLPDEVQHHTRFAAAIGTTSTSPLAGELVRHLAAPAAASSYARAGLDPA
ncbi:substrate-binding domain-containing protein [Pseudonocardia sp. TRM90224]|uniref:substrate-binding domain-containing protein n=1 Tax=Pseudonocardia sp. TRM90224 TaxID=2812678 RepID=UPI001E4FC69F|nr:substrate-binding domain-containing protein [Pseudonocardia sp. TRM90224]